MKTINVVVKYENGLHARPAVTMVELVKSSKSEAFIVTNKGIRVNCKSLIRVLTTGIKENEEITIEINGEDEDRLAKALTTLFNAQ